MHEMSAPLSSCTRASVTGIPLRLPMMGLVVCSYGLESSTRLAVKGGGLFVGTVMGFLGFQCCGLFPIVVEVFPWCRGSSAAFSAEGRLYDSLPVGNVLHSAEVCPFRLHFWQILVNGNSEVLGWLLLG